MTRPQFKLSEELGSTFQRLFSGIQNEQVTGSWRLALKFRRQCDRLVLLGRRGSERHLCPGVQGISLAATADPGLFQAVWCSLAQLTSYFPENQPKLVYIFVLDLSLIGIEAVVLYPVFFFTKSHEGGFNYITNSLLSADSSYQPMILYSKDILYTLLKNKDLIHSTIKQRTNNNSWVW